MRRSAFTLVEVTIAGGIALMVLGVVLRILGVGSTMARTAQRSETLQDTLLLQEELSQDIRQLGVDPAGQELLRVMDSGLSFYRVVFDATRIRLRPVRYTRVARRRSGWLLARTEVLPTRGLVTRTYAGVPLRDVRFSVAQGPSPGSCQLRVEWTLLDEKPDAPAVERSHPARATSSAHTFTVRIPIPGELGNPALAWAGAVEPEAELLALNRL